jgi:hypothetical protein
LVWEDPSGEAVAWVQDEFDALWGHPQAFPLSDAVILDIDRLSRRQVVRNLQDWTVEPASAFIETPVYRKEVGLWEHQKYFVKIVFDAHRGPMKKARYVLADQVGLGKTIHLAMAAQLIALTGNKPILIICPKTLIWQWQSEMQDLLDMPSAVWDGRRWVDEREIEYPVNGVEAIRKCPRRVGVVSSGLISRGTDAAAAHGTSVYNPLHQCRESGLGKLCNRPLRRRKAPGAWAGLGMNRPSPRLWLLSRQVPHACGDEPM